MCGNLFVFVCRVRWCDMWESVCVCLQSEKLQTDKYAVTCLNVRVFVRRVRSGRLRVLSFKVGTILLCAGQLEDKYRCKCSFLTSPAVSVQNNTGKFCLSLK